MKVDQKQITTIHMHDAKGGEIRVVREGTDYQLQLSSDTTVVNITLGLQDIRKLCQGLVQLDVEETWKPMRTGPEFRSTFFPGTSRYLQEAMASWFARMASGSCETAAAS